MSAAAGWFGKLPVHGDFVRRRLDAGFVEPWDAWLAQGLAQRRSDDPAGWLQAYLASPSWRFVLAPGVLPGAAGRRGWTGVLMPSVDRVGRYFPLTAALPLDLAAGAELASAAPWPWLARLDALLADALQDDWDAERLDAALQGLGLPQPAPPGEAGTAPPGDVTGGVMGALRATAPRAPGALWVCDTPAHGLLLEHTPALPRGAAFSALLARPPSASQPSSRT